MSGSLSFFTHIITVFYWARAVGLKKWCLLSFGDLLYGLFLRSFIWHWQDLQGPFCTCCTWSPFGSNCNKLPSQANPGKKTVPAVNHVCHTPDTSQPFQQITFALWLVHVFMLVSLKADKRSHLARCNHRHRPLQETWDTRHAIILPTQARCFIHRLCVCARDSRTDVDWRNSEGRGRQADYTGRC